VACFLIHNGFVPQKNFANINVDQANKMRCSVALDKASGPLKRKHILTVQEFQTRLSSEEQCWQYLTAQRWPQGLSTARLFIKIGSSFLVVCQWSVVHWVAPCADHLRAVA
jgi:hypothetical protein